MIVSSYISGPLAVNSYVVADEATKKAAIIDAGGHNNNLANYIKTNNLDVEYIILTHGHGDHIGGVQSYRKEYPKAKLVVGIEDKEMLANPRLNMSNMVCGIPISLNADQYVSDGEVLKIGQLDAKIIHTPGHTPGGICIYIENMLFSGDTLFEQSYGRTDFPGSSYEEIQSSIIDKLFVLPDETVVMPGHMGPTKIGFEKETNPIVQNPFNNFR